MAVALLRGMDTPQTKKADVAARVQAALGELKTLRDDLRVRIHLASQDARDKWSELEPRIEDLLLGASAATSRAVKELLKRAREIDGRIAKG